MQGNLCVGESDDECPIDQDSPSFLLRRLGIVPLGKTRLARYIVIFLYASAIR